MDVFIQDGLMKRIASSSKEHIHVIMIATKPDIIKQYPFYVNLKKQKESVILVHTGQHYDYKLSGGMLEEFGLTVDINLNIEGAYHHKVGQIIERLGDIFAQMKTLGKTPVPYVHGDTMTAMAASAAAFANEIACVHVEAGIRTLGLKKEFYKNLLAKKYSFEQWYSLHQNIKNFEGGQIEPYPEQYNTRATEPATGIFLAPVTLAKKNLIKEGFLKERIFVVGNSVADALQEAKLQAKNSKIFTRFPMLKNGFIRFCIHRRENCGNKERFTAIFESMEILVKKGEPVLLISLFATEKAVNDFGLRKRLDELQAYENFVYSEVWPMYTDVIAAMEKASVCATDSGSMQEEMNILGIPTVTLRFGSDRPESFFAGGNIIAPPVDGNIIATLILGAKNMPTMKSPKKIYGSNVAKKSIRVVTQFLKTHTSLMGFYDISK